ncbi:hypothetical protein B0T09DRAFT_261629, partial [Sordaria sp. MPI-SDFR-AT-0083]
QPEARRCSAHLAFYMSMATRALVAERLARGEYTCSGKYCRVVPAANTVYANCRQASKDYRLSKKGQAATGGTLGGRVQKKPQKK